ncbi:MAG: hypothetical protein NTW21_23810 [Verrucomicrobia bacterium]|nr:hypothetical protein [Verrucomicrobiota bacterium]
MNKPLPSMSLIGLAILGAGILPVLMYRLVAADACGLVVAQCAALTTREMNPAEQWLAFAAGFVVKPVYMLLAFIWIVWLWRRREPDLAALRHGLSAFWLGENACTVNYLCFGGCSDLWEYFHNFGMAVGFAFIAWAVLDGVDRRLLKLSAPKERCAAMNLCKTCIKYSAVPCKLQRVFKMLLPATLMAAVIPFTAGIKLVSYDAVVMGATEHYALMASSQLFENYYCPAMAILLMTASWLVMLLKRSDPVPLAKVLFAAALGPLGFGFMRLFLSGVFADKLLWYVVWEEVTELIFVAAVGYVLWVFRHTLLAEPGPGAGDPSNH